MPKVIKREDPKAPNELLQKVRSFISIKGRINDLSKEETSLKKELTEIVDQQGETDEKGHIWLRLPEEVDGYVSLKRERRVSQKLDEEYAENLLKSKGLFDRCYRMLPILDEAEVMAAHFDGLITEEEIDTMFPKSVSYAFIPSKS